MSTPTIPAGSSLKERLREVREELILDAAYDLLLEVGYGDMSMDEVAARTGMSKATIYQFFPSKQELAVAVAIRNMQQNIAILDTFPAEVGPADRMERALRQCLKGKAQMDVTRLGIPRALVQQHPRFGEQKAQLNTKVAALIKAAQAAGEIRPDVTADTTFALLQAIFHANLDEIASSIGQSRPELIDAMVAVLFRGLRADLSSGVQPSK